MIKRIKFSFGLMLSLLVFIQFGCNEQTIPNPLVATKEAEVDSLTPPPTSIFSDLADLPLGTVIEATDIDTQKLSANIITMDWLKTQLGDSMKTSLNFQQMLDENVQFYPCCQYFTDSSQHSKSIVIVKTTSKNKLVFGISYDNLSNKVLDVITLAKMGNEKQPMSLVSNFTQDGSFEVMKRAEKESNKDKMVIYTIHEDGKILPLLDAVQ